MLFFFLRRKKKQPLEIESVSALQNFPGKKIKLKKTTFGKKQPQNLKNGKKKICGNLSPRISQTLPATQPFYRLYVDFFF